MRAPQRSVGHGQDNEEARAGAGVFLSRLLGFLALLPLPVGWIAGDGEILPYGGLVVHLVTELQQ